MQLYSDSNSIPSHRIRLVLAEKHIDCQIIDVDPLDLPDDIMDLNPYGSLPTLLGRDLVLYDAQIISEYLDERFPHPPLMPVDPAAKATLRMYMYRIKQDWYQLAQKILANDADANQARKRLSESLTASAPIFAAKPFFMNDEFAMPDTILAPLFWRLPLLKLPLNGTVSKQINRYAARLFSRPGFKQSLTEAEIKIHR